ncbi:16S rRNA (guanine(527)-N(7))-methyltransferase RsmG [Parasulfuritortus cantonensis]|uniref:Ribosomal RNA small subunit methyltransferase G n=1 Tax=Parasulfuritortus cantonensis TaxID=2528202 RepID=A0A4R1B763_9PROT|nr:16S rRNA (guanine(527)-N(7))-methyltransferase RsmG [Parasulfuritortus cantonensis]TCJ12727.1 16S rRNA (guanine(527)-N(7))-methyltransferase RsmG [Parasulfuritortus cantonensis]
MKERLDAALAAMGLDLPGACREQLLAYLDLLRKWNKTYNLTAIHEPERMLTHHLLDSLAVLPYIGAERLLDVGAGAGLPGIPLAIARPGLAVTLIDASHKKVAFMHQAAIELGLDNVKAVHGRVEQLPAAPFPQIISRAFSDLSDFVRLTRPLLAEGGEWLAMKGLFPNEELAQLKGARLKRDIELAVPGLDANRHLIVLEAA